MTNDWDEYAAGWDDDPAAQAYATAAFDSLTSLLDESDARLAHARVLDFGCGTGLLTERLAAEGASILAVDTSAAMLHELGAKIDRHAWESVHTSATLPDDAGSFDLVVCSSVCAFVDDYPATVARLVDVLRPGGRFVQWDWERTDEDDHGLTRSEIRDALRVAGLVDVTVETGFAVDVDEHTMSPLMGSGRRRSTSES